MEIWAIVLWSKKVRKDGDGEQRTAAEELNAKFVGSETFMSSPS